MSDSHSLAYFSQLKGERIPVTIAGRTMYARLTDCRRIREARQSEAQAPFNLTFLIAGEEIFPQASYDFDLPGRGVTPLFIVPIERTEEGVLYEAVFT